MHTDEQRDGWARVADAVHAGGGHIFVQLMHAGRIAHPDNKPVQEIVAPSAIAAPDTMITPTGPQPFPTPRALETDEIAGVVDDFVHAARQAVAAGLDGVEIHAANGYLVHQFLAPSSNRAHRRATAARPANRARSRSRSSPRSPQAIGPERVGIRISPAHNIQGVIEDDAAGRHRRPTARSSTPSPRWAWPTCPTSPTRAAS